MTAITPKLAGRSPSSLDSIVLASGAVSPKLLAARAMSTPWPRRSNGQYPRTRSGYSPRSGRPRAASGNTWKQRHAAAFYKREAADTKTTDPDDRPAPGGCAERGGRLCAGRTACSLAERNRGACTGLFPHRRQP